MLQDDASQMLRFQERVDRQLACARREIADSVEQVAQQRAQESMELLRSQVLGNHTVLQKDVAALQTSVGELRLRVVAAGQEEEEQRRLLLTAQETWSGAIQEVREQLQLARAEFTELLETTEVRLRHAAEVTANGAVTAAAASLRDDVERVVMRADSSRGVGEQAARDMFQSVRAQVAELEKGMGSWTAQLADVKESCFGQLADLKCSLDMQVEQAKLSAHERIRETKFTASLISETKDALVSHVDKEVYGVKDAVDAIADHMEQCKSRWDQSLHSLEVARANTREELVRMLQGVQNTTDQRVTGMQHSTEERIQKVQEMARQLTEERVQKAEEMTRLVAEERIQKAEEMARLATEAKIQAVEQKTRVLTEDVAKGYRVAQSESQGEAKAEAECLKRWMEAGLEAQGASWRVAVSMLEGKQHELQESQCELHVQHSKKHDELAHCLDAGLVRLADKAQACERHVEDVVQETTKLERHLQDASSEAAHQAQQVADAIHRTQSDAHVRYAEVMRSQDHLRQCQDQHQAEQIDEWRKLAVALRHVEERTAWLSDRTGSAHDSAFADIRTCLAQQESAQLHRQDLQQRVAAMQDEQSSLQKQQQVLDDRQSEQQQHAAKKVEMLTQDLEALRHAATTQEHLLAKSSAFREREDASLTASVFAAEERQIARQEMLKRSVEEHMSDLTAGLRECVSSRQAQDDATQHLKQSLKVCEQEQQTLQAHVQHVQDEAMHQMRQSMKTCELHQQEVQEQLQHDKEDAMQQLRQDLKVCEQEHKGLQEILQNMQDDTIQKVKQSIKSCEQEQQVMREQSQHDFADMAEHLMKFSSRLSDTHGIAEQSVQSCEQLIRDHGHFTQELGCSDQQQRELRQEQQNAVAQLSSELGASEARILTDQRLILSQVHEIGKAQEAQEVRAQRCAKRSQVRHTESGEAVEEIRKELLESRQTLLRDVTSEQTALAQSLQRQIFDAEHAAISKGERLCEDTAQAMSEKLRKELGLARYVHEDKLKQLQDRVELSGQKTEKVTLHEVAEMAAATAACARKADENAASVSALQGVQRAEQEASARNHAETLAEMGACRELVDMCFLATQRAAAEHTAAERGSFERAAAIRDDMRSEVGVVRDQLLKQSAREVGAVRDQMLEQSASQVGAVREELLEQSASQVRAVREQLLEQSASQEPRLAQLGEAVTRLEDDGGPSSRIAGAAAAAASKVRDEVFLEVTQLREGLRDEVFQEVTQLRERLEAVDDQMIFLRGEVAPDVLRGFLQPSVFQYSERAAADQLARFRKDWGADIEWRLDCVAESLHSIYLKVGLPARGALAALRQDLCPT